MLDLALVTRLAPRPAITGAIRAGARGALLAGVCTTIGWAISAGGLPMAGAAALCGGVLILLIVERLRFRTIVIWIALTGVAYPVLRYPRLHPIATFDRVWILATVLLLVLEPGPRRTARPSRVMAGSLVAFCVLFGARALASGPVIHTLQEWLDAILLPTLVFVYARRVVRTRARLERLASAFVFAGITIGSIAVAERLFGFELASMTGGQPLLDPTVGVRVSGPFTVADVLAVSLLVCLAGTLYMTQLRGRAYYLLGGVAITIELLGITFTFFRGAAIAALVIVVVAIGWRPKRYARLLGVAALVAAVAAVVLLQAGDNSALSGRINNTQNISGRLATYAQGIKVFASAPLTGVGIGRFYEAEPAAGTTLVRGVQAVPFAHNSYLEVLAEQGLVGFGAFLLLTAAAWRLLRALRRSARSRSDTLFAAALSGAALAYLLMSLELTTITSSTPNIMLASLLGAGAGQLDARIGRTDSPDHRAQDVGLHAV